MQVQSTRMVTAFSRRKNIIATTVSFESEHTQNKILGLPYPNIKDKPLAQSYGNKGQSTNYRGHCEFSITA